MAMPIWQRFEAHLAAWALFIEFFAVGTRKAAAKAMTATTTSTSISVKAEVLNEFDGEFLIFWEESSRSKCRMRCRNPTNQRARRRWSVDTARINPIQARAADVGSGIIWRLSIFMLIKSLLPETKVMFVPISTAVAVR